MDGQGTTPAFPPPLSCPAPRGRSRPATRPQAPAGRRVALAPASPGCPAMPRMTWIGKEAVLDLHRHVPLRLLDAVPAMAIPGRAVGHELIEGDNLEALRALLPRH